MISIYDASEAPIELKPGWVDVLRLRFHDAGNCVPGLEPFTNVHARQIIEFVTRHEDAAELVVHCHEGQRRSAAVALFVTDVMYAAKIPCFQSRDRVWLESYTKLNRPVFSRLEQNYRESRREY